MDEQPNNSLSPAEPNSNGQVADSQFKPATSSDQTPPIAGETITPVSSPDVSVENAVPSAVFAEPATSEPTNTEPNQPAPADTSTNHNPMAIPSKSHKGSKPTMVIILAVIVALVLAGLVMFMYLKSKAKPAASTQSSSAAVVAKPQASPSDVDTTNQQIDTSLSKADDSKDFAPADMSDATLGL